MMLGRIILVLLVLGSAPNCIAKRLEQALAAYERGLLKFEAGASRSALAEFERVIELAPNLVEGYTSAAACSLR
jgi:hypothetical protein